MRQRQRRRDAGFIVSLEMVFIAVILVIGLIVGWVAARDAVVAELHDIAEALGVVDQSFSFAGLTDPGTNTTIAGSSFTDAQDNSVGTGIGNAGLAGDQGGLNFNVAPDDNEDGP